MSSIPGSGVVVALTLATIACGGGATTHTDPSQATPYCSVSFAGGITGKYDCHVALQQVDGAWQFTLNSVGTSAPVFRATLSWPTLPALDTAYTLAAPGTMTSATATAQPGATSTSSWVAGPGTTTGALATKLTAHYAAVSGGPCGDFSGTLVPDGGSTTGQVQVTAHF